MWNCFKGIRKVENYRSRTRTLLHAALQWNRAEFPVLPGLCLSDSVKANQSDRMKAIKWVIMRNYCNRRQRTEAG